MFALPISEVSQVADARRRAGEHALTGGFDATATGRLNIVVTELATNLIKHAGGGTLLVQSFDDPTGSGVEILALDKGRGMFDTDVSRVDGYSTAGTQGQGLGAIARQSQAFAIYSRPQLGTVVMARLTAKGKSPLQTPLWGAVSIPKHGEVVCGDGWSVLAGETPQILVVDGLGHGQFAYEAATAAKELFAANRGRPPKLIMDNLHNGLRATRGAAIAVAQYDSIRKRYIFSGIGNIAGTILSGGSEKRTVSLAGTAGYTVRKIDEFEYPADPSDAMIILASDGIGTSWTLNKYPGLGQSHPSVIAGVIYRDFVRGTDDATVLVVKVGPA